MRAVWQLLSIGVLNVAALVCGAAQHRANARMLFHWVQVGPEGTSVVRAITDDACPKVRFDSGKIATNIRSESNQKFDVEVPAAFPVRVCEVPVPAGSITGTLGGKVLPIARPNPRRIVVIGDSGCRSSHASRPGHSRRRLRIPRGPLSSGRGEEVWRQPGAL